jgi:hypothetical protein
LLYRLCSAVFFFLLFSASFSSAQQSLTDDSIIKMTKAGLDNDLIVQSVNSQPGRFATSADDLIQLKQAGVSDKVLATMISKGTEVAPSVAPAIASPISSVPPGIDEIGVYYQDKQGRWTEMSPEIINFKSGGFLKSLATDGIVKGDWNGHLNGTTAKLTLSAPVKILLAAPEGTVAEEYQVLKLRVNSKDREFRSTTGGVFHASTGAKRDSIDFTAAKIAPHIYEFSLPAGQAVGEYGILPPGSVSSANAASGGKLYTFRLLE